MPKKKKLHINYEDFLSIMKELDNYIRIKVRIMPKKYPCPTVWEYDGPAYPEEWSLAVNCESSDLAYLIWNLLTAGENGLEDKHGEMYFEEQIKFFKGCERVDPKDVFAGLGKPAQMRLIREGALDNAVSEYEERLRKYKEWKRKEPERKQALLEKIRKESIIKEQIRETDKMQCVFCGHMIGGKQYCHYKYIDEPDEHKLENGFLSCKKCLKKELALKFGRFLNN